MLVYIILILIGLLIAYIINIFTKPIWSKGDYVLAYKPNNPFERKRLYYYIVDIKRVLIENIMLHI